MTTHLQPLLDLIDSTMPELPTNRLTIADKVQAIRENHVGQDKPAENGIVRVLVKVHYGTQHYYPANPTAELFRKVQGGKTLTAATLKILKTEGYKIQYRYEEPAL